MGGGRGRRRGAVAVALAVALLTGCAADDGTATSTTSLTSVTTISTTSTSSVASTTSPVRSSPATTAPSATSAPTTAVPAAPTTDPTPPRAAVDQLVVAAPAPDLPPYRRAAFGADWSYDPATGCNTRERVLIAESLVPAVVDDRCRPSAGRWVSAYDGVTTTDPADLQIDHFIPLADAWRSGAAAWTADRRLAFANDLTHPETLIAVTGSTNQSKGDRTPDEWLPPDRSSWCSYATSWVAVKKRWSLTVTPPEKATLVQVLAGC